MLLDLTPFFTEYESLVAQVDVVFQKVSGNFSTEVTCRQGCSDCCHALFDVTLVEALYLNAKFSCLAEDQRNVILIEADKIDRKAQLIKKKTSQLANSTEPTDILLFAAKERLRCPLLDENEKCTMYAFRPVTCRVYGIPLEIGGKSHTCGISGFEPGKFYPAVKLERIQDQLLAISNRILDAVGCQYEDFRLMHVPVSTSLMTVYSEEYFGVTGQAEGPASSDATGDRDA